jgi:2-haloacid dehalogenase
MSVLASHGIRVCAFDAYGTLFDFNTAQRCADLLGDRVAALRELWRSKQLQYFWQRNMLGEYKPYDAVTADALDVALGILGIDTAGLRERLIDQYDGLTPFPDVRPALEALKRDGIRRVIHTNATVALTRRSIASSGLAELFDDIISIDDIGVYKPHPAAYRYLVERAGGDRDAICFISSNGWDVHGAAHFGLKTAWINRAGHPDDALPGRVLWELRSLSEFGA